MCLKLDNHFCFVLSWVVSAMGGRASRQQVEMVPNPGSEVGHMHSRREGEGVEVTCKVMDEDYLGSITLESGREGLRCRFAWNSKTTEVPAQCSGQNKVVKCQCDSEV